MDHTDVTRQNVALARLNEIVNQGRAKMAEGLEAMAREYHLRRDYVVQPKAIDVAFEGPSMRTVIRDDSFTLTPFARGQFLTRAGIPQSFADNLLTWEQQDLLRENISRLLPVVSRDGLLIRTVDKTAK